LGTGYADNFAGWLFASGAAAQCMFYAWCLPFMTDCLPSYRTAFKFLLRLASFSENLKETLSLAISQTTARPILAWFTLLRLRLAHSPPRVPLRIPQTPSQTYPTCAHVIYLRPASPWPSPPGGFWCMPALIAPDRPPLLTHTNLRDSPAEISLAARSNKLASLLMETVRSRYATFHHIPPLHPRHGLFFFSYPLFYSDTLHAPQYETSPFTTARSNVTHQTSPLSLCRVPDRTHGPRIA
jgi:hypothetical protein